MSGMDRHSELQQHKTAAEYRQAADEHVRTLKDFWKDFLVSGLFVLAAIVAIFACLAWFAANNRVSATGGTIGAKADRYTLTAAGEGESGAHVGYYERSERTPEEKDAIDRLDTTDAMTVTLGSNLNNETAGSLYPGARGKITFGSVRPGLTFRPIIFCDCSMVAPLPDLNSARGRCARDRTSCSPGPAVSGRPAG